MKPFLASASARPRVRIALAVGLAAMLPSLLRFFAQKDRYVTFNIFEGILYPVVLGGLLIGLVVLLLLLAESRFALLRFWPVRVLAAVVLVNLIIALLLGAADIELPDLLGKIGLGDSHEERRKLVRRVVYPAILGILALSCIRKAFIGRLYKFFVVAVAVFGVLAAYRVVPAIALEVVEAAKVPGAAATQTKRSVVWVIFDELDQEELARGISAGRLPEFERLQAAGLAAVNARSPAARTMTSLPRLLTGEPELRARADGRTLKVSLPGAAGEASIGEADNLIASVQQRYGPIQLLGFYHPYCRHFPQVADCRSYSIANMPGVASFLVPALQTLTLSQSDKLLVRLGINPRHYEAGWANQMAYITRRQSEDLERFEPGSAALHMLHLNVPHLPRNLYANELFASDDTDGEDPYQFNLRLADRILGSIVTRIANAPAADRVLLIVSGDHGRRPPDWRNRSKDLEAIQEHRHVPLILWTKDARGAQPLGEPVDTTLTRELIERYLSGEVRDLADARNLLLSVRPSGRARPGTLQATTR